MILLVLSSHSASVAVAQSSIGQEDGKPVPGGQLVAQSQAAKSQSQAAQSQAVETSMSFPSVQELGFSGVPLFLYNPVESGSEPGYFALAKVAVVSIFVLLWLRALQICAVHEESNAISNTSWTPRIFGIGLAGIVLAIILPAYVPGAAILLASTMLPFLQYATWRSRHSPVPNDAFKLRSFFSTQASRRQPITFSVQPEFALSDAIASSGSSVQLIGKSPQAIENNFGFSRGAQSSEAFQGAISLIDYAVASRATDLHITTKSDHLELKQRIDGSLISLGKLPLELGRAVINVFKVMCDMNIADRRRSQDGSFLADINQRRLSFRVSAQGTHTGEKLSIRILDPAKTFSDLASLGMQPEMVRQFGDQLGRAHGLILIVGTTGAGKSTTACAALQSLDSETRNIVSIEDPIEYQMPSVDQIEVNHRAGQTFQSALRSVLRLDADVIFIGEIRDEETAKIACQAAQAGQLVVATMHANDSVSGTIRLAELGMDLQTVTASLRAVLAQSLVRKLCPECREAYTVDAEVLERMGLSGFEGQLYRSPNPSTSACSHCDGRGFLRRTGLYELTEIDQTISELLHQRAPIGSIAAAAKANGMTTLKEEALRLIREGVISIEEMQRACGTL